MDFDAAIQKLVKIEEKVRLARSSFERCEREHHKESGRTGRRLLSQIEKEAKAVRRWSMKNHPVYF